MPVHNPPTPELVDVPAGVTFNPDGSITTVYGPPAGVTVITTFGADGSIVESFGPPTNKTLTTTFAVDGSINQGVS